MKQKGSCPVCQALVIAFTNAMQAAYDNIFSDMDLSSHATPKATWKRCLGHCVYCGEETDWNSRGKTKLKNSPELDHWIPISLGGPPTIWNMLLACKSCNSLKGNALWPYPLVLLKEVPELISRTNAARELAVNVWGEIASTNTNEWTYCEIMSCISKRWPDISIIFGSNFSTLQRYMNTWQSGQCTSMPDKEISRMLSILERETEKELYG